MTITHYIMEALSVVGRAPKRGRDHIIDEPMPPEKRLTGIDVSKWQGRVNWRRVAEDHTFAIIKATEGVSYVDPRFHENASKAKDAGLILGAYHFGTWHNADRSRPELDARAEAEDYVRTTEAMHDYGYLPPVLDLEWDGREDKANRMPREAILAWALEWLRTVENLTGMNPMIYTGPNFIQRLGNPDELHRYPLWLARYTRRKEPTRQVAGWPWVFWQYTGSGSTAGVEGKVDINRFAGSMADLRQLCGMSQWPKGQAFHV